MTPDASGEKTKPLGPFGTPIVVEGLHIDANPFEYTIPGTDQIVYMQEVKLEDGSMLFLWQWSPMGWVKVDKLPEI